MIKNLFPDAGGVILDERAFEEKNADLITGVIKTYTEGYSLERY